VTDQRRRAIILRLGGVVLFGRCGWPTAVNTLCFEHVTFIKLHLRVCNRTDASEHERILRVRATGDAVWAVLEVLITKRRPTKWEWRVCDRYGTTIMGGFESTRRAAKYRGYRALFHLLAFGWDR
jgi:hypothetical protein